MRRGAWRRLAAAAVVLSTGLVVLPFSAAITATAAPDGFDTCDALSTSAMRSIAGYTVANIYIGGENLSPDCPQSQLTADWVSTVTGAGWRLLPTFVGKQAPCANDISLSHIGSDPSADGTADADTAAARMDALRLPAPNVVYDDMEPYDGADSPCAASVAAYLDAFISRLHTYGFRVGVYGVTTSMIPQLVAAYNNPARQRPDDIWIAHPDGVDTTADAAVPASYWVHHRVRQYTANDDFNPPNGDPSVKIDKDAVDADTAAPAADQPPSYAVSGTGSVGHVNERDTPDRNDPPVGTADEGAALTIICQTTGEDISGDTVWDRLDNGNYISDLYTTTPGGQSFAGTLPQCGRPTPLTARITAPLDGTQVNVHSSVTFAVYVPITATSVQFATSVNNGSTWQVVATVGTTGGESVSTSFTVPGTNGTTAKLRAIVSDGGTTWQPVNSVALHVVGPVATMSAVPVGTTAASYTFHWTGLDGSSRATAYDVRYRRAPWNGGFGSWSSPAGWTVTTSTSKVLSLAVGYEYCVEVRAYGLFSNVGDWSSAKCVMRVLDDRAMTASTGWTRGTASGYYNGTWTSSKTYGAALTRTNATVGLVGVLATTCASCGSVAVYVGNTYVGTISLVSSTTRLRQLRTVRAFAVRSKATVTLRAATSGKVVQIDGLLLYRSG